jgi:Tripartite tricarboxylate transporter family receptor
VTGAAGNIAADRTAKANPDGYTIGMLTGANIVINVSLYNKLSFDPLSRWGETGDGEAAIFSCGPIVPLVGRRVPSGE